jgi:hypothetical protein
MKWKLFVLLTVMAGLIACDKSKYNTKPSLKLRNISSREIPVGGSMVIEFDYTDKEGDISNQLILKKERNNRRKVSTVRDSLSLPVPDFPKFKQGVVEATLTYQFYLVSAGTPLPANTPTGFESDSLTLKFVLKDKSDNVSDTVVVENVVIQRKN